MYLSVPEGAINCLDFSFQGAVKVWDPRQNNDPVATMEPGEGETKRDCWTVAFGKDTRIGCMNDFAHFFRITVFLSHLLNGH